MVLSGILLSHSIIFAPPASADAGVGMLMIWAVPTWAILLLVIIPLEAAIGKKVLQLSVAACFKISVLANLASTLLGIVLTWASLLCCQIFWYMDPAYCWTFPINELVWCVPCFFASVWIEDIVARRLVKPEQHTKVRQWAWKGNLASYALLVSILLVMLFYCVDYSIQHGHSYDVPTTGTPALDKHIRYWKWVRHHSIAQETRFAQMISLMSRGRYREALPICNVILEGQPCYSWAHACRSFIERNLSMDEEALADAQTAIKEDPTYDVGFGARADILYAIGVKENATAKIRQAITDYSQAISYSRSDDVARQYYVGRARCYVFLGDFGKALQNLDALPGATDKELRQLRSIVLEKLGRTKEALAEKQAAEALRPPTYVGPDWHQLE